VKKWDTAPLLPIGVGGEQRDAGLGLVEPGRVRLLRNGLLVGPGLVRHAPDWVLADTCKNIAGPVENHAVCGIFPFTTQGGASAESAGIAFSFNATDDIVYLHQLDENGAILRTFSAFTTYTEAQPPQITGFEMFGKFYFADYSFNTASGRKGLSVFDPAGVGAITHPTFDLSAGGAAAAVLRFRGISKHRGATILGWGYQNEEAGLIDMPHILRWCKYLTPDTWIPDTTDQTANFAAIGTLNLAIVACAMSGQVSIVGKAQEIFALDGDYSSQFYVRQIGQEKGPVSTVGMVSIGDAAVWMSLYGPMISENGGPIAEIALDRVARRFLSYLDLARCWTAHDSARNRVVFALRRKEDDDGELVSSTYLTDLLWWDYKRNEFGVQGLPNQIFCIGTIRGQGVTLAGPTGTVSALAASGIGTGLATVSWTPGDANPDVTFEVQYRQNGTSTWLAGGTTPPATPSRQLSGLNASTHYDTQVRQIRNGQVSAYTTGADLFTTSALPATPNPAAAAVDETGNTETVKGITYSQIEATWTGFTASNTLVRLYRRYDSSAPTSGVDVAVASASPGTGHATDPSYQQVGQNRWYWLRTEATDGSGAVGSFVSCTPAPITPTGAA
jgi:hypothetical protein